MSDGQSVSLTCHSSTPSAAVRAVDVDVHRSATTLTLAFRLDGDIARIRVPPQGQPHIGVHLWRHTCFEAFVAAEGAAGYHELNFSTSREWTLYAFRGYRDGAPLADERFAPEIAARATPRRLELDAIVALDLLSASDTPLRLGLAAVIEADDGALSYWALRHPAGKPDFHHADGFALRLEPPGSSARPRPR